MKGKYRVVAFIMALFLLLTALGSLLGAMSLQVLAANEAEVTSIVIKNSPQDSTEISRLRSGSSYYVEIEFEYSNSGLSEQDVDKGEVELPYRSLSLTGSLRTENSSHGTVKIVSHTESVTTIRVTFTKVTYSGNSDNPYKINIRLSADDFSAQFAPDAISEYIPSKYLSSGSSGGSSGGTTSDYDVYSSDIVVENVIVRDKEGNQINGTITKDSPPFTVDVVYTDFGENMERIDREDFRESTIQAMITNAGNFIPNATTRGAVSVLSTSNDFPRFQVRFTDISFEGGANGFAFRVIYQMEDQTFSGTATAAVYQAKPEEEDEDDELAPPTPYIIISQYSYGSEQIEAGQNLSLEITYQNTSTDIALENIVMTVTPDSANMAIASASNTFYIDSLPAGASRTATIELQAKPAAEVGSHEVGITFNYEYISSKERKPGEKNEKIAIPITQIDRFDVDPVTELSEYLTVGDEGYVTISFINRGKSTTYNISGVASGNLEMIAPSQHFGNLEAGKSDSIDVTFVPQEAGELYGEVTVQYEDENTNQKTIRVPFTVFVEEPYIPPAYDPDNMPGMELEETGTLSPFTVIFCVVGGLMIAFPLAMYLMKRVKVKGIEDFDEDF